MRQKLTWYCLLFILVTLFASTIHAQNFAWAVSMGGSVNPGIPSNSGEAIKTDAAGNVIIAGSFAGTVDFNPGTGIFTLTAMNGNTGSLDMFIQKLDANGNFLWAKQIVGDSSSRAFGIALDASDDIYVTGNFRGTKDFDPGAGIYNLSSKGNADIFVLKLDANGNFIWASTMGGVSNEGGFGIVVDNAGNSFVTGRFLETVDFDPGRSVYSLTSVGNFDIFVFKLDNVGNFAWATQLGGVGFDYGNALALDTIGNVYVTGAFTGTADFDPGPGTFNITASSRDIFIWKLSNSGNFVWARQMKCNLDALGYGIAVDNGGNVYYTGHFWGTVDFNPGPEIYNLTAYPSWGIYIAKLNNTGEFSWVKQFGNEYDNEGLAITVDASANVYTTGYFEGTIDFDPGVGIHNIYQNNWSLFIEKLDSSGKYISAVSMGGNSITRGNAITVNNAGSIFSTGYFGDKVDFDPGLNTFNLTSTGQEDIFVLKLGPCSLQPGNISGSSNVCAGSSQTYSVNPVNGAASYSWVLPSGWIGNSTTNSITTIAGANSGNISVTANNNCGSSTPQTLAVNVVNANLLQPGPINGSNSICQNSSQTYSVSPVNGALSYTWTLPSGWTGSSATNSITTTVGTGSGNISVTANNSCGAGPLQSMAITVMPQPVQPGIITGNANVNQGQTTLYSIPAVTGAAGYNWTLSGGGSIISGQNTTSVSIAWKTAGNYTLSVNAVNTCGPGINKTIAISVTGITGAGNHYDVRLTPNPGRGINSLTVRGINNNLIAVKIYDMLGQVVYTGSNRSGIGNYFQIIDLKNVASGLYRVEILIDKEKYFRTIVKL